MQLRLVVVAGHIEDHNITILNEKFIMDPIVIKKDFAQQISKCKSTKV